MGKIIENIKDVTLICGGALLMLIAGGLYPETLFESILKIVFACVGAFALIIYGRRSVKKEVS